MSPIPPPAFDDAAAAAYEAALRSLADDLVSIGRIDATRASETVVDWSGASRRWFDRQHAALTLQLEKAVVGARAATDEVAEARAQAARAAEAYAAEVAAAQARAES